MAAANVALIRLLMMKQKSYILPMLLAMVAPNEWGRRGIPYEKFVATVKLLADHTWEIIENK